MPMIKSYADVIRDWELLIAAFNDNTSNLTVAEPQRTALEQILKSVRDSKALQDSHAANRQETTQALTELVKTGREQARRLRGMVKGLLGTKNERLVQFKVAPLRSRSRTKKVPVQTPPTTQPQATPQQHAVETPAEPTK